MKVSFFEEFPDDKRSLEKIKLISFPSNLFVAAKSLDEFLKYKKRIEGYGNKWIGEIVYWPILSREEGYWFSPFARRSGVERIFSELRSGKGTKVPVMLDLEFPITRNPLLLFTQFFHFFGNKRRIRRFLKERVASGVGTYTVEYPFSSWLMRSLFTFLGASYSVSGLYRMKMYYHSLHPFSETLFRRRLSSLVGKFGERFVPGLGCTAVGIHGNEPLLSTAEFGRDLRICSEEKVGEVVVFRLGGLTKEQVKVIKEVRKNGSN